MRRTRATGRPTDGELEILQVLWRRGPCTVRDVHDELKDKTGTGYTTVLKILQIMHTKGIVTRQDDQRTHIYAAAAPENEAKKTLVRDLIDRAFEGSASDLVMRAMDAKKPNATELAEIRRALEELEKGES
jgi:predicted transcriptional regulator